ncbi:MAG: DUF4288 domain-containing protein, partial [Bacteroidota bacterium]|nr:DUF4288 domain-containing protein [Bacteroidota bacterium]
MKAILGLQDWNLTVAALPELENPARVHITVPYPHCKSVLGYPPAERTRRINAQMRKDFSTLKALLGKVPFEKMGTHFRPIGAKVTLPLNRLPLLATEAVKSISIEAVEGFNRQESMPKSCFWSIKVRFVIQIANETGGRQKYEDRIMLVKALDQEDAQRKLLPSFESYSEPYLNSAGLLVRWRFEQFLDAYLTDVASLKAFLNDEGVEVFSELGNRKLKP